MPPEGIVFVVGILIGAATWLLTPIARALAERLRGGRATNAELQSLRDELMQEQQALRQDMGDLGERLDFTERLLAKQRDGERLPPGQRA